MPRARSVKTRTHDRSRHTAAHRTLAARAITPRPRPVASASLSDRPTTDHRPVPVPVPVPVTWSPGPPVPVPAPVPVGLASAPPRGRGRSRLALRRLLAVSCVRPASGRFPKSEGARPTLPGPTARVRVHGRRERSGVSYHACLSRLLSCLGAFQSPSLRRSPSAAAPPAPFRAAGVSRARAQRAVEAAMHAGHKHRRWE
jgi:hypothetical protein